MENKSHKNYKNYYVTANIEFKVKVHYASPSDNKEEDLILIQQLIENGKLPNNHVYVSDINIEEEE